ncbi:MAG TPA: nucleoside phosphorylase [Acidimicrobiales bacterium]|jgi:uridine phosphorylase|nr:nucleoside phosphorylase [Acidimicrobiales bacterium]
MKHGGTPLIRPEVVVRSLLNDPAHIIPECVILGYSTRLHALLAARGFTNVPGYSAPWRTMWLPEKPFSNRIGVVEGFGFGAPGAAIVIEELATLGVRRFISLGLAGALPSDVGFGDVVLCTGAIRDEGVSHHYLPAARYAYPTPRLTDELRQTLISEGSLFSEGPTWTLDAVYRETVEEALAYRDEGVVTVEMEAAALFTIAQVRDVDVAAIFTVSDHLLAAPEWSAAHDKNVLTDGLARILDVALKVLCPESNFVATESSHGPVDSASPFS